MSVIFPSSSLGQSPEVSLCHVTFWLSTTEPALVQEREMVVADVDITDNTGAFTKSRQYGMKDAHDQFTFVAHC